MNMNDKLAALVDKCASTRRGARGGRAVSAHRAAAERGRRTGLASTSRCARRCFRVARAARLPGPIILARPSPCSTAPGSACRDERDRATLLAEAERLHAAAVADDV